MDNCKHLAALTVSSDSSVLNPQKWACHICATTESVWACLSCGNVACGRYIAEHAVKHYEETKHPLAIEVNDKYVYCYECGDYVLNDNVSGEIQMLRTCLQDIAKNGQLSTSQVTDEHKRLLRTCSVVALGQGFDERQLKNEDLMHTALWFRRHHTMAKVFRSWHYYAQCAKKQVKGRKRSSGTAALPGGSAEVISVIPPPSTVQLLPRRTGLVAGMTGLRNLGNTCYMNSVLQTLSCLTDFREYFIKRGKVIRNNGSGVSCAARRYIRQTTIECYEHINSEDSGILKTGGLSGGGSWSTRKSSALAADSNTVVDPSSVSLSDELSALLRVMWSGKWAVISPHQMLSAVWILMPFFKGFTQHDAQEFLGEFLDRIQVEVSNDVLDFPHTVGDNIITELFEGQLISLVRCEACNKVSKTFESFMDLSLDFPERYHGSDDSGVAPSTDSCHLNELLSKFIQYEKLDGPIYACDSCNVGKSTSEVIRTEAEKRLLVSRAPHILRLHLKRFMWGGRNSRGKIVAHVEFDDILDLTPFYLVSSDPHVNCESLMYRLTSVVIHHGRGFLSGHYTAYCWNSVAESWVHCNDSTVALCTADDVHHAQAYILVYSRIRDVPMDCSELNDIDMATKNVLWPYNLRERRPRSTEVNVN